MYFQLRLKVHTISSVYITLFVTYRISYTLLLDYANQSHLSMG